MLPSDSCTRAFPSFRTKEPRPSSLSSVQPSPWAGFEYFVARFRPGEFVLQFTGKVSGLEMCIKVNDILHLFLYRQPILFVHYPPSLLNYFGACLINNVIRES